MFNKSIDDQELHEDAVSALQASERLREILDDMLRLRMLESGAVHLHRELVAADALIRDAVNSIAGAARARQVAIAQVSRPSNHLRRRPEAAAASSRESSVERAQYSPDGGRSRRRSTGATASWRSKSLISRGPGIRVRRPVAGAGPG